MQQTRGRVKPYVVDAAAEDSDVVVIIIIQKLKTDIHTYCTHQLIPHSVSPNHFQFHIKITSSTPLAVSVFSSMCIVNNPRRLTLYSFEK